MDSSTYSIFQNIKYIVKTAWKNDKLLFFYFLIYTMAKSIIPFMVLYFPKFLLDNLMAGGDLHKIGLLFGLYTALGCILYFASAWIENICYPRIIRIRFKFIEDHQRTCLTTKYENTESAEYYDQVYIAFRCLNNNNTGIEGILHKLFNSPYNIISLIGYSYVISKVNLIILLILILQIFIGFFLDIIVTNKENKRRPEITRLERKSTYLYRAMSDLETAKEILIFNSQSMFLSLFKALKKEGLSKILSIRYFKHRLNYINILLSVLVGGLIYWYVIRLVINNVISISEFLLYFTAINGFSGWLSNIIRDVSFINNQNFDINNYRKFIEPVENETIKGLTITNIESIRFDNVSYKYPNTSKYALKGLNLTINPHKSISVVGRNGAGKTTFVKLLMGLYSPTEGSIWVNNINIKDIPKEEYFKLFSAVFQESVMTAFSIEENIALADREEIETEKIYSALKSVGLLDKVKTLELETKTPLKKTIEDNGVQFSGGEEQRIALARALYKDAPVLVLDEPTASLDPITESQIYETFHEITKDKIAIFISHRLASSKFCDQVIYFENGIISEAGTHDELMKKEGKYMEMFSLQASYYRE